RIKEFAPTIRFISIVRNKDKALELLHVVQGICLESIPVRSLLIGIHCVREGGIWLDGPLAMSMRSQMKNSTRPTELQRTGVNALSPREHEVLKLITEGLSNEEIAKTI